MSYRASLRSTALNLIPVTVLLRSTGTLRLDFSFVVYRERVFCGASENPNPGFSFVVFTSDEFYLGISKTLRCPEGVFQAGKTPLCRWVFPRRFFPQPGGHPQAFMADAKKGGGRPRKEVGDKPMPKLWKDTERLAVDRSSPQPAQITRLP